MVEWRDWGVYCAGTLDTKPMTVDANYITLDEVISLVFKHPSFRYVPNIIEEIQEFMAMDVIDLNGNMAYLKNSYLSEPWN